MGESILWVVVGVTSGDALHHRKHVVILVSGECWFERTSGKRESFERMWTQIFVDADFVHPLSEFYNAKYQVEGVEGGINVVEKACRPWVRIEMNLPPVSFYIEQGPPFLIVSAQAHAKPINVRARQLFFAFYGEEWNTLTFNSAVS